MSRLDELYELAESGEPLTREDTQYLLDEALRLRKKLNRFEQGIQVLRESEEVINRLSDKVRREREDVYDFLFYGENR